MHLKTALLSKEILTPSLSCNAPLIMIVWKMFRLLFPLLILNNALKRNVPRSGLLANRTPSASQLSKNVRRNVEQRQLAGNFVSQVKKINLPSMLPNVLLPTNALVNPILSSNACKNLALLLSLNAYTTNIAPRLSKNA